MFCSSFLILSGSKSRCDVTVSLYRKTWFFVYFIWIVSLALHINGRAVVDQAKQSNVLLTKDVSPSSPVPVVLYHGMGDTAHGSLSSIEKYLEELIPNIYVTSIRIGNNTEEDFFNSYFKNLNDQVNIACATIASDQRLRNGYNAIGFSQGGQIVRAIAQRCPQPPMRNLISIGGQHQGVYGLPSCFGDSNAICDYIRRMINLGVYLDEVQNDIVQAEYWHDPLEEQLYAEKSVFLADINNERTPRNESYAQNLSKLNALVLVAFNNETVVEPKQTELFEFYEPGQTKTILPLEQSPIYLEDRIGLKKLNENGRLYRLTIDGNHLQFNRTWFRNAIVEKFLINN